MRQSLRTVLVVLLWASQASYVHGAGASGGTTGGVRYANTYAGPDAAAKIAACIADLPSTGGTCDARGLEGAQTWGTDPFAVVTKPVRLILGATTYSVTVNVTVPTNVTLDFYQGGSLSMATGKTTTIRGPLLAPPTKIFTPNGTGLVSFYGNPAMPELYPQWWGAKADNSTDDSAAIQAAITAATATRPGVVRFPTTAAAGGAGTYIIGTTLVIPGAVTLKGDARAGTILKTAGTGVTILKIQNPPPSPSAAYGIRLEDLQFIGPGAGSTVPGIVFINAHENVLNRVWVTGFNDGVSFQPGSEPGSAMSSYNNTIRDSVIVTNNRYNIDAQIQTNNLTLYNLTLGSAQYGLHLVTSGDPKVYGGNIEGISTVGIDVDEVGASLGSHSACLFSGIHFEGNTGRDIRLGATNVVNGCAITSNMFGSAATTIPIDAVNVAGLTVTGNTAYFNSYLINYGNTNNREVIEEGNIVNVVGAGVHGAATSLPNVRVTGANKNIWRNVLAGDYTNLQLRNDQNSASRALNIIYAGSAYASVCAVGGPTGEQGCLNVAGAYPLVFGTSNTARWLIYGSGHLLTATDNTYDIGASGAARPRSGYFGTSVVAPIFTGALSGNAATATALAANPVGCTGNNFALGINASGVAQCAQPSFSSLSGTATNAQLPTAEFWANKNAASGYAGLTAAMKLNAAQGQKVWALADLTDVTGTTGAGSTVMFNEVPVLKGYTVANLPPPGVADRIAIVTDAATVGSCTSGGGNSRSLCRDTGSAWEPLGDGGGGGGSAQKTAASSLDSAAPSSTQIPSAEGTLVGGSVSLGPAASTPSSPNNVRLVGPGGYSTIQEALDTLPNTTPPDVGGTVHVMPNYSETLTSNISVTTESTTIEFLGPAVLTMGTNSIQIAPGLRNVAIRGTLPWGGHSGSGTPAVTLDYRGTGAAIQVGSSLALTENVVIENLYFSLEQAGANATAIDSTYLQRYQFNNIRVNGSATATQVGIQVQGGSAVGHWSGAGVISLPYILMRSPGSIGVQYKTLGNGPTNQNEIRGGTILGAVNLSGIGVNYAAASGSGGNSIYSLAIKGYQQGVRYTAENINNVIFGGTFKDNGLDVQFDAGANNNEVHGTNGGNGGILTVTNNGTNNIVWSGGTIVSGFLTMAK